MSNLITDHAEAMEWVKRMIAGSRALGVFGTFGTGVVWTEDGNPFESQDIAFDPRMLVSEINKHGLPLLVGHDPGKPMGKVIAAELFQAADGKEFVGVVFGRYEGADVPGFSDFPFDFCADPGAPDLLPQLGDTNWIEIGTDPKEVDADWVRSASEGAPLPVRKRLLSHNAAITTSEIVRVVLPYVALVWNPFITKIASRAGEDVYDAMRKWLDKLFRKIASRKNPIMLLQGSLNNCDVCFIVRGNDEYILMAARDALGEAANQAYHLTQVLLSHNAPLDTLFYEFDVERKQWKPSYGVLRDGRLITDNRALILAEKLPSGLSLGLGGYEDDC